MTAQDLDARLAAYTAMLQEQGAIRSPLVERAFRTVRRDRFVPTFYDPCPETRIAVPQDNPVPVDLLDKIYSNVALCTHFAIDADGRPWYSTTSEPGVMASMLEALDLCPGMRALEIGAGTGYNAVLLAAITGAEVVTVEANTEVVETTRGSLQRAGADGVRLIHGDGYLGHAPGAPYQRIIVTAGCAGVSPYWLDQLDRDGLILAPIAHAGVEPLLLVRRRQGSVRGQAVRWAGFMHAHGPLYQWPADRFLPTWSLPAAERTVHPLSPELDFDAYTALWFYLGVRDRRATRVPVKDIKPAEGQHALIDPDLGTVHLLKCGQAKLDGDERLLRDLARYYQEWEALGRPAVPDWSCELSPTGVEDTPIWVPDRWRLRGEPIEDALVRLAARRG